MYAADEHRRAVVEIDDYGLRLVQDRAGTWQIEGSADGLIYPAVDRLVWLLPLLERAPADLAAALPRVTLAETPMSALVRFALTAGGQYWPALALEWLESGWPSDGLLDALAAMKDSREISQPLRHRALRLWLAAERR